MRADLVSGILLALLGVYAGFKAQGYGLGALSEPGAGFFPFGAAVLLVVCGAVIAFRAAARLREAGKGSRESVNWGVWICVAILVAYTALLPLAGFGASTFLVLLALTRLDKATSWAASFTTAILGAIGYWVVFVYALGVSFPPPAMGF